LSIKPIKQTNSNQRCITPSPELELSRVSSNEVGMELELWFLPTSIEFKTYKRTKIHERQIYTQLTFDNFPERKTSSDAPRDFRKLEVMRSKVNYLLNYPIYPELVNSYTGVGVNSKVAAFSTRVEV
jgi:hypothetical protein